MGQVPFFDVSFLSVSLDCCKRVQRYIKWSGVCSSFPQGHVELSVSLNPGASSVGIATGYGLEGPGIGEKKSRWGRDFPGTHFC
jgi:hypothetical protein